MSTRLPRRNRLPGPSRARPSLRACAALGALYTAGFASSARRGERTPAAGSARATDGAAERAEARAAAAARARTAFAGGDAGRQRLILRSITVEGIGWTWLTREHPRDIPVADLATVPNVRPGKKTGKV